MSWPTIAVLAIATLALKLGGVLTGNVVGRRPSVGAGLPLVAPGLFTALMVVAIVPVDSDPDIALIGGVLAGVAIARRFERHQLAVALLAAAATTALVRLLAA